MIPSTEQDSLYPNLSSLTIKEIITAINKLNFILNTAEDLKVSLAELSENDSGIEILELVGNLSKDLENETDKIRREISATSSGLQKVVELRELLESLDTDVDDLLTTVDASFDKISHDYSVLKRTTLLIKVINNSEIQCDSINLQSR